jgi:pantoate--beta-alanine ligase
MLPTVSTIHDLRTALLQWREAGESVALVPTMGALHKGHMSLVSAAQKMAKRTVVSIFVNPAQFGPKEDLSKYPRPLEADQKLLTQAGADLLYTPSSDEIYPQGFVTSIDPGPIATLFEGAVRPGHFAGVATVVVKLLLQIMPDIALFGEKDYQQLLIIRRVVSDLNLPVHIAGLPIVRDDDGLAFSSRNLYLTADERSRALALPQALQEAAAAISAGQNLETVLKTAREKLTKAGFVVDYVELVDAHNLTPLTSPATGRLIAAARMGTTRLLDHVAVG